MLELVTDFKALGLHGMASAWPEVLGTARIKAMDHEAVLRQLIRVSYEVSDAAYQPQGATSGEILDEAERKIFAIAEQQQALRERLTREFTASERRVAASQSTLSFLRQQVDIWSNSNR